jgi:hypothetical protein
MLHLLVPILFTSLGDRHRIAELAELCELLESGLYPLCYSKSRLARAAVKPLTF